MKRKKRGHLKKMALLMFLLLVACVGYFLVVNGVIHYSSKLKSFGIIKQEEHNTASDKYGWELMLVNSSIFIRGICIAFSARFICHISYILILAFEIKKVSMI